MRVAIALLSATALAATGLALQPAKASAQGLCLPLLGCVPNPAPSPPGPPASQPLAPCKLVARRGGGVFVGMVAEDVFGGRSRYRDCALSEEAASGVDLVRQTFDWAQIERAPGRYDFAFYDGFVAALAQHRIGLLPIVFGSPRFRSSAPRGATRGSYPPRRYGDLGRFAAVLVRRYGPRGTFWRGHPGLPRMPVRSWQIWNEPNIPVYWPSGPSPRRYTRLLGVTARAIKRVDPRAEIVTAGLPNSRLGMAPGAFLAGMYRFGGRSAFDTLGISSYASSARGVVALVSRMRRLMDRHGDRDARIWVTEFGWATGGPSSRFRVTPAGQASRLSATLRTLSRRRGRLRLRGAVYYNWRDGNPYPPLFQDFFGLHTGLLYRDGARKPAYFAFRAVARGIR